MKSKYNWSSSVSSEFDYFEFDCFNRFIFLMRYPQITEAIKKFACLFFVIQSKELCKEGKIVFRGIGVVDGYGFGEFV